MGDTASLILLKENNMVVKIHMVDREEFDEEPKPFLPKCGIPWSEKLFVVSNWGAVTCDRCLKMRPPIVAKPTVLLKNW